MTTVAVLCDPPRPGLAFGELFAETPLSPAETAELYAALTRDTVRAVVRSGGDPLVNYRPDNALDVAGDDAEAELRELLADIVDDDARFEPQVGESLAGRIGNTATHLLEAEAVASVAVARPEAAFFARTEIDGAAMKLRSTDAVVGPAPGGRVHFAAFGEPIDFADCLAPPAVATLTDRCLDAGLDVEFLERKPLLETAADLAAVVTGVRTRRRADGIVPRALAEWVADSGLAVEATDDGLAVTR
ncbi:hypothetical protein BRC88_06630 [Halobacteriales archaeon QS_4_69_225]|nr:MAG: hypothetical protein BRC88_06630 [Halobacteriales archaeon QS_4_69_225]